MALSPNYGWSEPDNSSLVKNGAADIRTLGDAIDASLWNVGYGQAGKNAIINGGFDYWQRGTSFSNAHGYNADRWLSTGATAVPIQTISRQSLTPGDIQVTGLPYFFRHNVTNVNGATGITNQHRIENVQTFAGQTVTLSFYAKADAARTVGISINQSFGSGGSADVAGATTNFNLTTSWARYSMTVTLGSLAGKTIGTSSFVYISLAMPLTTFTIDYTGFQLEAGSKATPFSRTGGTLQGELAACQRYFQIINPTGKDNAFPITRASTVDSYLTLFLPVTMRTLPSIATSANWGRIVAYDSAFNITVQNITSIGITADSASNNMLYATMVNVGYLGTYVFGHWDTAGNNGTISVVAEL